jgi:hypothetical protein
MLGIDKTNDVLCELDRIDIAELCKDPELPALTQANHRSVVSEARHVNRKNLGQSRESSGFVPAT